MNTVKLVWRKKPMHYVVEFDKVEKCLFNDVDASSDA